MTARRTVTTRPAPRLERGEDWTALAVCQWQDPELFFAPGDNWDKHKDLADAAKAVCEACPVVAICLERALAERDDFAILGGKTPRERRAILRRRAREEAS